MKRCPTLLLLTLAALLASPTVLAQPEPGDRADPRYQGDTTPDRDARDARPGRGAGDGPRGDRHERGHDERADRGQRGRGERGNRGGRRWRLTEDQLDHAIEIIDRIKPELAQELRATRDEDPAATIRRITEEFPRVHELIAMHADDPARFDLHVQSIQVMNDSVPLIRALRRAQREDDPQAVTELTAQIREKVEAMFDIRMAIRRLEIEDLRARIAELEEQLAQAQDEREQHIDERTQDIVNRDAHSGRGQGHGGPREGDRPGPTEDRPEGDRPRR
ncbi:MAG: hypothetical protein AAGA29_06955 [Planctomycetota bacterium]